MKNGIHPQPLFHFSKQKKAFILKLDYHEYDLEKEGLLKKLTKGVVKITQKIKAALCVKEMAVFVDDSLHHAKKPFGQGHELGHFCIKEHKDIFYCCSEHDLSPKMRKEMEFEANDRESVLVEAKTLAKVLDQAGLVEIDYVILDIEGAEYPVLQVFPFERFKIEIFEIENNFDNYPIEELMVSKGYTKIKRMGVSDIYQRKG